ncbi:MAG: type II and III secretion system protein family protein [Alphaproteobacteria bacterium]|nr:type II and III secretion system protein family protein [Alphaproteobacteria bacterium]
MARQALRALIWAAAAALTAAPSIAAAPVDDSNARVVSMSVHDGSKSGRRMVLGQGKGTVIQLDSDARDVLVSNPEIVDAVVRTPRRIFLLGMKTGQTNAFFFDGAGHQILSLDIRVEKDTGDLGAMIHTNIPGSNIKVSGLNDNVVLTGTVANAADSTRAQDLAARFAGDPAKVVNMLSISGGEQVMLKVRIAEMDRNIAKQFGLDIAGAKIVGGSTPIAVSTANQFNLVGQALSDLSGSQVGQVCDASSTNNNPFGTLLKGGTCNIQNNVQGQLKALERVGLVHMLAEPNLTTVSGETAKFLAGGEFPVPVSRDRDGNVTVEFKQFGVGLSFTPVVVAPGRISLQLSSEVSELTNTGAFTLTGAASTNGLTIPALSVRRAQTTVELPSGGSFAVAGLMQHNTKQVIDGFPGVKDLPVLGALFRSRDFADDQSELVVLVSAYMVEPTSEAAFAAPTDGFVAPSDPETLLLGRLNATYKRKDEKPLSPQASAPVGFIVR